MNTLSLDKVRVDRRAIETRGPITLTLPVPPSTNALFVNVPGKGRVPSVRYKQWRQDALATLWTQPRKFMGCPCAITLIVPDKGRRDLDNFAKPILDFLVQHNFIADDSREFVRDLRIKWSDVEGVVITIEAVA